MFIGLSGIANPFSTLLIVGGSAQIGCAEAVRNSYRVIPADAGIQEDRTRRHAALDPGFRRGDAIGLKRV